MLFIRMEELHHQKDKTCFSTQTKQPLVICYSSLLKMTQSKQWIFPFIAKTWSFSFIFHSQPIEIVDLPIKHHDFPSFFVCLPEGNGMFSTLFNQDFATATPQLRFFWVAPGNPETGHLCQQPESQPQDGGIWLNEYSILRNIAIEQNIEQILNIYIYID